MFDAFQFPYVQRALLELLILSVGAGVLGTWIVLRGLAFFAHAAGTATFPGLVVADGLGFAAPLGALAAVVLFTTGVERLAQDRREGHDSLTALVLVGALAVGVILASDVFHSGSNVETLLFGSLLVLDRGDVALAAVASGLALAASVVLGRTWLATGFDPAGARALGVRSALPDAILLGLIALVTTAELSAIGALLTTALLVIPAATVRLWTRRLLAWQLATVALVALEGVAGLWISVQTNAPPGATIAMLAGGVFALAAIARALGTARLAVLATAAVPAALALSACTPAPGAGGKLDVVATTTQIGDWARAVGGGDVAVHQILQPNTDPHEYEPRPSDVAAVAGAKLVLLNGDGLDGWIAKVVSQSGGHPLVADLGGRVPVRLPGESSGPAASRFDPHWWHDPVNARAAVAAIRDRFVRADPKHASVYRRNAASYLARLRALDRAVRACIGRISAPARKLVTDHDAFEYFAHRYGIRIVGAVIGSQTTAAQPSSGGTADLVSLIQRERVAAVFPETSINSKLARAIARQTGAASNLTLYGDTLGPKGSRGATYLGMEAANAAAMARGLSGGAVRCPAGPR